MDIVSNCCNAPIIYTDVCSDCKEHCDEVDLDKDEEVLE